MIFSQKQDVQDVVVQHILKKNYRARDLLVKIGNEGYDISRQALYDILRKLVEAEVIVKHGLIFSINTMWIRKVQSTVSKHANSALHAAPYLADMEEGDSLTFHFSNPTNADRFWGHIYLALQEIQSPTVPAVIYFPHPWIYFGRTTTEQEFYEEIKKRQLTLFGIGGETILDKVFQKELRSDTFQVNTGMEASHLFKHATTIQGEYMCEFIPDEHFTHKIHAIFTKEGDTKESKKMLTTLAHSLFQSKIKVIRNKKKTNILRKRFAKDFFVPPEYSTEIE